MGKRSWYGPAGSGAGPTFRATRQQGTWWWYHGVRLVRVPGRVVGWVVDWFGRPRVYDAIPDVVPPDGNSLRVLEEFAMSLLRKADMGGRAPTGPRAADDKEFASVYPVLWSYLSQCQWEDGTARDTSSLLIFAQDGILKAMLRDRDAGLCLWGSAPTVGGLFEVLEGMLSDPKADWRQDRQQPGQTAKRVGKKG